mgnify:FL=1
MTQLETMQHAKQYLDQLSNGTDPITQEHSNGTIHWQRSACKNALPMYPAF